MATIMKVALPVIAIGAAAFTGGTSLGLLGADAGMTAAETGFLASATEASGIGSAGLFETIGGAALGAVDSIGGWLPAIAGVSQLAGTAMQAYGYDQQSQAVQTQANIENQQLKNNANNDMATAEIKMEEQNRETAFVLSNVQAAATAQGGTSTDPTVTTNMKTIAGEGRYRALTDMYQGAAASQQEQTQANLNSYNADLASTANTNKMYSTILGGGSSLYDRYSSTSKVNSTPGATTSSNLLPWQQPGYVNP